jgi:hypothetical protein
MGTGTPIDTASASIAKAPENEKTPPQRGFLEVGCTGLEPVTSGLSSRRSPS